MPEWKKIISFISTFDFNFKIRHVEYSFHSTALNFSTKCRSFFRRMSANVPKNCISSKKYLSSKYSYGNVNCKFVDPAEVFSTEAWLSFAPCRKFWKSRMFSKNYSSSSLSYGHVECSFDNTAKKNFDRGTKFFCSLSEKSEKSKIFSWELFFVTFILWTRGM